MTRETPTLLAVDESSVDEHYVEAAPGAAGETEGRRQGVFPEGRAVEGHKNGTIHAAILMCE